MDLTIRHFPEEFTGMQPDPRKMHNCLFTGFYEEEVRVNGESRRFYSYLTEDLTASRPALVIAIPSDADPVQFMRESGLGKLAAEEKLYIFLAVSQGEWDGKGRDADYLNALYKKLLGREHYILVQECIYMIGIGDGLTAAHEACIKMPENWSGIAGTGMIGEEITYFLRTQAFAEGPIQMPVYLALTEENLASDQLTAYWKSQNGTLSEIRTGTEQIFSPSYITGKFSINDVQCSEIRITHVNSAYSDLQEMIVRFWQFLKRNRRHRGIARKHMRPYADWREYGAEEYSAEVDGYTRTWLEYVPESVRNSGKSVPLVVVMHGRTQSSEIIFDLTSMSWAAEQFGFIAVFPRAGIYQMSENSVPNVPLWQGNHNGRNFDDVKFIRTVVAEEERRRTIDHTRIYACGFSSGGCMSYDLGIQASDLFAAICCFSGFGVRYHNGKREDDTRTPVRPIGVKLIVGARDDAFADAGADNPYGLKDGVAKAVTRWAETFGSLEYGEYSVGGRRYKVHTDRQGIPMLTVCTVDDMPHAVYPSESFEAYEFFCQFSRIDGELYYMGRKV